MDDSSAERKLEEWRSVVGFPNYEISTAGTVRNVNTGKALSQHYSMCGYPMVFISNGKRKCMTVHSLVAAAFIGPRPRGFDINHKDGSRTNCHPDNLVCICPRRTTLLLGYGLATSLYAEMRS